MYHLLIPLLMMTPQDSALASLTDSVPVVPTHDPHTDALPMTEAAPAPMGHAWTSGLPKPRTTSPVLGAEEVGISRTQPGSSMAPPPDTAWVPDGGLNVARLQVKRQALPILAAWGAANVVGGLLAAPRASGPAGESFWQMSAGWGAINLGLATVGLINAYREGSHDRDPREALTKLRRTRRVLLINSALDVGYMALGGWLWARGDRGASFGRLSPDTQQGWGRSIVGQGAFLLAFDLAFAAALTRAERRHVRKTGKG